MDLNIVTTKSGKVQGYERNGIMQYLGIPYAEEPVGNLRLKRAVKKNPWKGVYDAKEYGNAPIQLNNGIVMGDEDCLSINIERPLTGEKLPVFVWIYGGGYNTGFSADEMYHGEAFGHLLVQPLYDLLTRDVFGEFQVKILRKTFHSYSERRRKGHDHVRTVSA